VPRLPEWQTSIRWFAPDGANVETGQELVRFEASSAARNLEDRKASMLQAEQELTRVEASGRANEAGARIAVEQARIAVERARVSASVPSELRSRREHLENQLALARAEAELEKSRATLSATRTAASAELEIRRLALTRARSEIAEAEAGISRMTLRATRPGLFVVADHPWEGRKMQVGDQVWVGIVVGRIPDLASLRIEASVADVDEGRLPAGAPATVLLDAHPGERFEGRLSSVSEVAQETGRGSRRRAFAAIVELLGGSTARLRPGLSAEVSVLRGKQSGALLAPREALDPAASPPRLRLAGGKWRQVALGPCNARECILLSGAEEGTKVEAIPPGERTVPPPAPPVEALPPPAASSAAPPASLRPPPPGATP
jgi:multidrug efflux pump subunit AcrA (membrane-fusion protein)